MKKRPPTPAHSPGFGPAPKPPAPASPLRQALAAVSAMEYQTATVPLMPTAAMIHAAALATGLSPQVIVTTYKTMIDHHEHDSLMDD